MSTGKVIQVIGPVVDVEFPPGQLPNIYNALKVTKEENKAAGTPAIRITLEVASHLGENRIRSIAMSTTDGLTRGMDVVRKIQQMQADKQALTKPIVIQGIARS